ncbi:hypothetical protein [Dactylosporangium sp. NPDC000521]|uniref:hypothetical protein n=1 Tax=Dactylosporangium sp. NPDC000521 TaxID=3363975 RepID=UPI0036BA03AF
MSEIYEYDVDGDGVNDVVEVTQYSDGSTLVVADVDGDGYGDIAVYDEDGDGVADGVVTPDDVPVGYADETASDYSDDTASGYSEDTTDTTSEPASEGSSASGSGQTYSEWAKEQDYQKAYQDSVYGDKNKW